MIDFHSHILPGIDDGASNIEESLQMLSLLKQQGVTTVVATPHFNGDRTIKGFIDRRNRAYSELKTEIESKKLDCPDIILGAEVGLNQYTFRKEHLDRLCIEGTNIIMFEMPYGFWDHYLYQMLFEVSAMSHLRVMIAHAERYFSLIDGNGKLIKLMEMQPIFQINTTSLDFRKGRKFIKLIKRVGADVIFGSDCHNLTSRKPIYSDCLEYISKKFGEEYLDDINEFGRRLLKIESNSDRTER